MSEPVSEPLYTERHITTVAVTHIGGGFAIHAVAELKDTVTWASEDLLLIQTHYPDGSINEDMQIRVNNCVAVSVQQSVQRILVKRERKAEQAAARAARNEPPPTLGGIDRAIS